MSDEDFEKELKALAESLANDYAEAWSLADEVVEVLKTIDPHKRVQNHLRPMIVKLYVAQAGTCPLCGDPLALGDWHLDHKIPFTKGGGNETSNIQLVHPSCNLKKGDFVEIDELIVYLHGRYANLKARDF
jgi:hypothetical protein